MLIPNDAQIATVKLNLETTLMFKKKHVKQEKPAKLQDDFINELKCNMNHKGLQWKDNIELWLKTLLSKT